MKRNQERMSREQTRTFDIEAADIEMLLFNFLQELIFLKDADLLLFNKFDLGIEQNNNKWRLRGTGFGDKIDQDTHELIVDVKAVSLHNFKIRQTPEGWRAEVILDI